MNKDTKKELSYLSQSTYQGKDKLYNIVQIESSKIDHSVSVEIKIDLAEYFIKNLDEKLGGKENNVLDLNQVTYLDSTGMSTVLMFNKLNQNKYYGKKIIVVNCREKVKHLFKVSGMDKLIHMIENVNEL